MKIVSWNVNGIRACKEKGFLNFVKSCDPDILAVQETKIDEKSLPDDLISIPGYTSFWRHATRRGYSGVSVYTKRKPLATRSLGVQEFDDEGRVLVLDFEGFTFVNAYFPNSQPEGKRLDYKIRFCHAIENFLTELVLQDKNIILCGDYNVAHQPIDLKNPKANEKNPGYLPEERAWMDHFLARDFVDTFRFFHPQDVVYSWWSYRFSAREKNIGWRIDYHCVNKGFQDNLKSASILTEVGGSDHCPVVLEIKE